MGTSVVFDDFIADAMLLRYERLLRICWDAVFSLSSPSFLPLSAQQLLFAAGKQGFPFTKELLRALLNLYRHLEESRTNIMPIDHSSRFEARFRFFEIYVDVSSGEELAKEMEASFLVHALVLFDSNLAAVEAQWNYLLKLIKVHIMLLEEKGAPLCLTRELIANVRLTVLALEMLNDTHPIIDFEAVHRELDSLAERGIVRACDEDLDSGGFLSDTTLNIMSNCRRVEGVREVMRKWGALPLPELLNDEPNS
jgi:hypothetical protein